MPLAGDPPGEYQIEYKLHTLVVDAAGELSYVDHCAVHLWLPPQFPHAPPVARPMFNAFHPNVSSEWIHLDPPWHPSTGSLVDVVRRCGELLAYQVYDPEAVYNPTAMEWASHYPHLLPVDPHAVLAPEAGGDPLTRIIRHGTQTLEQFKSQLTEMSLGILEGRPNTATPDVRAFGERISVSTTLFSEPDTPDHLRSLASELDEWARSMTPHHSLWDDLRQLYAQTRAAVAARRAGREGAGGGREGGPDGRVAGQRRALRGPAGDADARAAGGAARPGGAGAAQGDARRGAAADGAAVGGRGAVVDGAAQAHRHAGRDAVRTDGRRRRPRPGRRGRRPGRGAGGAGVDRTRPGAGRFEQKAIDGVVAWAGFTDLIRRGNELKERLLELGVAGIQAYTIQAPSGEFGPYQFEERVDFGSVTLVCRRIGAAPVHVYEARSTGLIGKGPGGVRVKLRAPRTGRSTRTSSARPSTPTSCACSSTT